MRSTYKDAAHASQHILDKVARIEEGEVFKLHSEIRDETCAGPSGRGWGSVFADYGSIACFCHSSSILRQKFTGVESQSRHATRRRLTRVSSLVQRTFNGDPWPI